MFVWIYTLLFVYLSPSFRPVLAVHRITHSAMLRLISGKRRTQSVSRCSSLFFFLFSDSASESRTIKGSSGPLDSLMRVPFIPFAMIKWKHDAINFGKIKRQKKIFPIYHVVLLMIDGKSL